MKDQLGDRMKSFYEDRSKTYLPRRTYTIIRIDGKAFHTYTRGCIRPFDDKLIEDMNETAKYLCKNIQGIKLGFVQSDEISILLTDFDNIETDAWFNGNIQKITSISASIATAKFNELRPGKIALFDSRVFTIPSTTEVENYFIWRQKDTIRNSVQSLAQSLFSQKQLHCKTTNDLIAMCLEQKGTDWNLLNNSYKNGRIIKKVNTEIGKTTWVSEASLVFTSNREYLQTLIPKEDA